MKRPLLIFVVLQLLDFLTTWIALRLGGTEDNPLVSHIMFLGPVVGLIIAKMLVISIAFVGSWMGRDNGIRWANVAFALVIAWNLSIITRLAIAA